MKMGFILNLIPLIFTDDTDLKDKFLPRIPADTRGSNESAASCDRFHFTRSESNGADSSGPHTGCAEIFNSDDVRSPGTAGGCVGVVESHPLQKRQRMGHPRYCELKKRGTVGHPPRFPKQFVKEPLFSAA